MNATEPAALVVSQFLNLARGDRSAELEDLVAPELIEAVQWGLWRGAYDDLAQNHTPIAMAARPDGSATVILVPHQVFEAGVIPEGGSMSGVGHSIEVANVPDVGYRIVAIAAPSSDPSSAPGAAGMGEPHGGGMGQPTHGAPKGEAVEVEPASRAEPKRRHVTERQ